VHGQETMYLLDRLADLLHSVNAQAGDMLMLTRDETGPVVISSSPACTTAKPANVLSSSCQCVVKQLPMCRQAANVLSSSCSTSCARLLTSEFDIVMICVMLATEAVTWLWPRQLFISPIVNCCYLGIARHDLQIVIA